MPDPLNPYDAALDGLELPDPVGALFEFCRERERIRVRRDAGEPPPWTDDPILRQGRFLNVFREDDRGSRAIRRFAAPVADDLPRLVQALFFARWCNRWSTLDGLDVGALDDPTAIRRDLDALEAQPWCNVTAYPVGHVRFEGRSFDRLEAATELFHALRDRLAALVAGVGGSVVAATDAVHAELAMDNPFPIFMAVADVAWFRPDVIDPDSPVPTGIGAAPFLDLLQAQLGCTDHHETADAVIALQPERWPEARRPLTPVDVEFLACECRKYFSYMLGTKRPEGRNLFRPGESARVLVDVAPPPADPGAASLVTGIHVIAGGPCTGKTTLLRALAGAGHAVEVETAERILREGVEAGRTPEELRADPVAWQRRILAEDHALFDGLPADRVVFTDTSFVETLVFAERAGIEVGPHTEAWLRRRRYARVFLLAPLEGYERTEVRRESSAAAGRIAAQVEAAYRRYGYDPVVVPPVPPTERLAFVLSHLEPPGTSP